MKKKLLFLSFVGMLLSYLWLHQMDVSLQNGNSDYGIIAFECAGNLTATNNIIQQWESQGLIYLANFSLGFDFLFVLFYVSFLAIWTSVLADGFYKKMSKIMATTVIGIFVIAGVLDGIENYALLNLLGNNPIESCSELAFYCASVKFALIGLGVIYILAVLIGKLFKT